MSSHTASNSPPLEPGEPSSTGPMDSLSPKTTQSLLVLAVFVLVTGTWELVVRLAQMPNYILPPPSGIWLQLVSLVNLSAFWNDFFVTMNEVILGYGFGIVIAVTLGVAIAQLPLIEKSLMPYIVAFQTIPSVALAPLFLQWFGYGTTSKVVMAALIAFFPILVNVIAGLQASGRDEIQMLRAFGASRFQVLVKVRIPNSLPYVFAGLNLGVVFALVGAIVAEFVGAKAGLGNRILQYNEQFNIAGMFAVLIVLAAMGMLMHWIVTSIKNRVVFWIDPHDEKV